MKTSQPYTGDDARFSLTDTARAALRSTGELLLRPRQFVAHQNIDMRRKLHGIFRTLKHRDFAARRRALDGIKPDRLLAPIAEADGLRIVDDLDATLVKAALEAGNRARAGIDFDELLRRSDYKYLISRPLQFASATDPILALAINPAFVKMVGDYIGTLPVILDISILYSPNDQTVESSSQFYHLDAQDVRTVVAYLFLHDLDQDGGPFVALTASASERFARFMNYKKAGRTKRLSDGFVDARIHPEEKHSLTGPAGSLFVCDTDRCFHYGSRKATRPRYVLAFKYVSPAAFFIPWRYEKGLPFVHCSKFEGLTAWQRLVVGASP